MPRKSNTKELKTFIWLCMAAQDALRQHLQKQPYTQPQVTNDEKSWCCYRLRKILLSVLTVLTHAAAPARVSNTYPLGTLIGKMLPFLTLCPLFNHGSCPPPEQSGKVYLLYHLTCPGSWEKSQGIIVTRPHSGLGNWYQRGEKRVLVKKSNHLGCQISYGSFMF